MGEDGRNLKQMSHEMPFKKLIWEFSREANLRKYSRNFSWVSFTRKLLAKLSVQSWKTWDLDHLTLSWAYIWNGSRKHPENMFFTQKQLEKHGWYKSLPKANKKNKKNSFWFDPHMVKHTHITFEHVQSHKWNRHLLNINLVCCVCVSNVE